MAVKVSSTPPAELTLCPQDPDGFPEDQVAQMPLAVREATIRLARSYASVRAQLARLIEWNAPGACQNDR